MARIIVIDDDTTTLTAARLLLERLGHEVVTATSGVEGIESYLAEDADLVLTDIFMPQQDGFETMKRLRSVNPRARVVCMSLGPSSLAEPGQVRDTMLRFAREFGADGSIAKPLNVDELRTVIDTALQQAGPQS